MSDLPEKGAMDITRLAEYTNKIGELASISKAMTPVYLRDFILGQDAATTLLARAVRADSKAKAELEYAESIAYLENAKSYLEARTIKDTSEARKQYVNIDPAVVAAKDKKAQTEAMVVLLKGKLNELRQSHDDLKKITYGEQNLTSYEGN
jgi:hypothetical protein